MNPTPEQEQQHPLFPILMAAIGQAMYGKGERHGGASIPFLEQPIFHYAKLHGRGFLTGQAAKKLEEAASTREGEAFIQEVLGAIVYAASAVLHEQAKSQAKVPATSPLPKIDTPMTPLMEKMIEEGARQRALDKWAKDREQQARRSVVHRTGSVHNCETCLHRDLEVTAWPCNECSKAPEVLQHWEPK